MELSQLEITLVQRTYPDIRSRIVMANPSYFAEHVNYANLELLKKFVGSDKKSNLGRFFQFSDRRSKAYDDKTLSEKLVEFEVVDSIPEAKKLVPQLIHLSGLEEIALYRSILFWSPKRNFLYYFETNKRGRAGNIYFAVCK